MSPVVVEDCRAMGITWVLIDHDVADEGGVADLSFAKLPAARPRVRYQLDGDQLEAMVVQGSLEEAVQGVDQPHEPITTRGHEVRKVERVASPVDPVLPTTAGLEALARLQRGSEVVFDTTLGGLQVRGLLEAGTADGEAVIVPCIGEHIRHIVVTADNRLLVLTEVADQPRGIEVESGDLEAVAGALWAVPREVTDSRITVYPEQDVTVAFQDGQWVVQADHSEQKLTLVLPLVFPAERFPDA